jgi:hypothetical protein
MNKITLQEKHKILLKVKRLLRNCGDYIVVTEGASVTHTTKPGIIPQLRQMLIRHEIQIGINLQHNWEHSKE